MMQIALVKAQPHNFLTDKVADKYYLKTRLFYEKIRT